MAGDQGHKNHITNGQRVSRSRKLSGPTLLYFLFSPPHFFNSNKRSDSRAPLKENLNKRVILCQPANGTWAFAPKHKANPSGKSQRAVSANALFKNNVSYLYCQVCPDCFTINNNFFDRLRQLT